MKIINKTFLIVITILLLSSCSGFKLKKKSTSGEEFLIEKKDPLILPPDFSELPEPNEQKSLPGEEDDRIKLETIFNGDSSNVDSNNKKTESGIEKRILEKIQKQ